MRVRAFDHHLVFPWLSMPVQLVCLSRLDQFFFLYVLVSVCVVTFKPQILAQVQRLSTKRRQPHSKTWCARLSIRVTCSDSKGRLTGLRKEVRLGLTLLKALGQA